MTSEISADFPVEPRFVAVLGSRMHHVEPGSGSPVLFIHGNPTSSYLWRNVTPYVAGSRRAIALDLIGMGKSDKPDIDYTLADHQRYLEGFIEALGLTDITLVVHDWGGPLGFTCAMNHEANVRAVAFTETIVKPFDSWDEWNDRSRSLFQGFRTPETGWDLVVNKKMFVDRVLPGSVLRGLTEAEMQVYRAPYVDPPTRKPIWRWPNEIPIEGEPAATVAVARDFASWLQRSPIPKLLLTATPGALIGDKLIAWCQANLLNLQCINVGEGSHFIQEDCPHEIGQSISDWLTVG